MLSGYRILDLTDERGHLAGKILADLGADVIKVEPPEGDALRRRGPFVGGIEDRERSLAWLALNTSKRGITLDLEQESGRETFRELAASSDAVLESSSPATLARLGVGYEALRERCEQLVWCSITAFGRTGPHAGYDGHDLVVVAMGGNAAMTGDPGLAPVRCTMPTGYYHACAEAAVAVAIALYARERSGAGQLVDVSMQECQLATVLSGPAEYLLHGREYRRGGARIGRTREIWKCTDGYVTFGLRGGPARVKNLIAMSDYMAECGMQPGWMREYDWSRYNHNALGDDDIVRLEDAYGAFFATKRMRELYDEALRRRILLAPCNNAREILEHAQLRDRGLFVTLEYAELGATLEHPGFIAKSDRPGIGVRGRAPRLGEHNDAVLGGKAGGNGASCASPVPISAPPPAGIFADLKILEFGSGAAGPMATRYFADHGATVVRVESAERPDFLRLLHLTGPTRDDADGLDRAPMFVLLNPNKKSVTLNLSRPEAIDLCKRLVAWADVVAENFAPGVMERWGLGATELRRIKPELIVVSSCLFGQTGPQRSYPGFGGQGAAIAGFNHLAGRAGAEAHGPYGTITDTLSPRYVGLLIAAALLERRGTGEGRTIDVSQIETGVYSLSEMMVRYSANQEILTRSGNHDAHAAPHAIYPCRGEDRWIAISVLSDAEWTSLVAVMGNPEWARDDDDLATLAGRLGRRDELDRRVSEWTRERDAFELMKTLQEAGVEAGVVQTFADLHADTQLAHRSHFETLRHSKLGDLQFGRVGFRLADCADELRTPGPNLGEHNDEILGGILGLDAEVIARLIDEGVVR